MKFQEGAVQCTVPYPDKMCVDMVERQLMASAVLIDIHNSFFGKTCLIIGSEVIIYNCIFWYSVAK
jgi:hypothetical protein